MNELKVTKIIMNFIKPRLCLKHFCERSVEITELKNQLEIVYTKFR